jgi:hypothetical protein
MSTPKEWNREVLDARILYVSHPGTERKAPSFALFSFCFRLSYKALMAVSQFSLHVF